LSHIKRLWDSALPKDSNAICLRSQRGHNVSKLAMATIRISFEQSGSDTVAKSLRNTHRICIGSIVVRGSVNFGRQEGTALWIKHTRYSSKPDISRQKLARNEPSQESVMRVRRGSVETDVPHKRTWWKKRYSAFAKQ
jgi:hypothetical protein